jgi:hypothetical protein
LEQYQVVRTFAIQKSLTWIVFTTSNGGQPIADSNCLRKLQGRYSKKFFTDKSNDEKTRKEVRSTCCRVLTNAIMSLRSKRMSR